MAASHPPTPVRKSSIGVPPASTSIQRASEDRQNVWQILLQRCSLSIRPELDVISFSLSSGNVDRPWKQNFIRYSGGHHCV